MTRRAASARLYPAGALKVKNPLINLPYLTDGADASIVVTQSNACLQYLGRKLQLYGRGLHSSTFSST